MFSTPAPRETSLAADDQLDQLMQVTSPRAWITLTALGVVLLAGLIWALFGSITTTVQGRGILMRQGGVVFVKAPEAGFVARFLVHSGEHVERGQPLLTLTPTGAGEPKPVLAPVSGQVLRRTTREGDKVAKDDHLLLLDAVDAPLFVLLYLPVQEGYQVRNGQAVQVLPANTLKSESGYLLGHVISANKYPISTEEIQERVQSEALVRQLTDQGPCLQIIVALEHENGPQSPYRWSSPHGDRRPLYTGMPCQGMVTVRKQHPYQLVFTSLANAED